MISGHSKGTWFTKIFLTIIVLEDGLAGKGNLFGLSAVVSCSAKVSSSLLATAADLLGTPAVVGTLGEWEEKQVFSLWRWDGRPDWLGAGGMHLASGFTYAFVLTSHGSSLIRFRGLASQRRFGAKCQVDGRWFAGISSPQRCRGLFQVDADLFSWAM